MQALCPKGLKSGKEPVAKIQLSCLQGGGTIVALTVSHIVADGFTAISLMKKLSKCYQNKNVQQTAALRLPNAKDLQRLHLRSLPDKKPPNVT
eukprot:gene20872-27713_t